LLIGDGEYPNRLAWSNMSYKVLIDNVSDELWGQYAKLFADYNFYQTLAYQRIRAENDGQELSRVVVLDEASEVVTMCHIRIRNIKPLGLKVGYVQWGPLVRRIDGRAKCTSEALAEMLNAYVGRIVNVLRIVPNRCDDDYGKQISTMFKSAGFNFVNKSSAYLTMMLRLDGNESEIRERFHRSWRRGLKKAEESNIEIRKGINKEYLDILEQIYDSARHRKSFKGLDPRTFIKAQKLLPESEKMNVVVAFSGGEPLTAHVTSHLGDTALGILAGSTEKGLELSSSYLVWWHTLLAAKQAGMLRYDLGGTDPVNNPDIHQFKLRMGSEQVRYIGTFDICAGLLTRVLWYSADRAYRIITRRD
jgi:lipid II:glycine glycyltransferase (peptidoglycan interpeptide bridge formation enzyme)